MVNDHCDEAMQLLEDDTCRTERTVREAPVTLLLPIMPLRQGPRHLHAGPIRMICAS